jgi:hypothetical protein
MAGLRRRLGEKQFPSDRALSNFLNDLLAIESGIDPAMFEWYVRNYATPVIDYPQVSSPGCVLRQPATGDFLVETMTVQQYFATLGVSDLFRPDSSQCITAMQYRAINVLGFVGYQIGESILIDTGYYKPLLVDTPGSENVCKSYYVGALPNSTWGGGRRSALYVEPQSNTQIIATDTNRWHGRFVGKNDIWSLEDLCRPAQQEIVIRDVLKHNFIAINLSLAKRGANLSDALSKLHGKQSNCTNGKVYIDCTLSGVLAAAHLCGATATADFLCSGESAKDEFGTTIFDYLMEFSGYDITVDSAHCLITA